MERFGVEQGTIASRQWSFCRITSENPTSDATPNDLWSLPRRRSASTRSVFAPENAKVIAKFEAIVVLPSLGVALEAKAKPRSLQIWRSLLHFPVQKRFLWMPTCALGGSTSHLELRLTWDFPM